MQLGARPAAAGRPASTRRCRAPPRRGGLLDAFDARLPFQLTAGQREVGETIAAELGAAAPDAPAAAGRGRLGQDGRRAAGDAAGRRRRRAGRAARARPRCSPPSTPARSSAMLGPLAQAGQLGGAETATRVALLTGSLPRGRPQARRCSMPRPARPGIVVGTHALIQEHVQFADSAWSSSTSSTASASSSATRCGTRPPRRRTCW